MIGDAATTATIFLDLFLVDVMLSGASIVIGIVRIFWHRCIVVLLRRCIVTLSRRFVVSSFRRIVVVIAGLHRLCCRHRTCLRHRGSHCCCHRCSSPSMVGCCVTYAVVCRLICHPPLLLLCDRQHFCRRPPATVPYRQSLPAAVLYITFAAPVDGWLFHSLPTQQHAN